MTPPSDTNASATEAAPRRRRKEARPQELMAAALALFVEHGFAATRLDDVAARAGVSKGTLYLYFDSKEALFEAVIREGIVPALKEAGARVAAYQGSASALLEELLKAWWALIGEGPLGGIPKLMISEARNFPSVAEYYYQNVIVPGRRLLALTLERGMAAGEFRGVDVDTAIDVVIAPLLMLAIWRYSMGPCCPSDASYDTERYLRTHLDIALDGLRCRG
ncbi:TetR/AcrR family transcriptional regulator [Oryzomicrobium sp.]|uniref:TetR/AcrR family transcriptional regulator n=1 Tax=Oryzomicrobium sp. TaxID=1911578 RepID=UPI0025EEEBF2|nr:TetR/AcrR family transcriptional regulator [Oryzomicrobium sp.]MCE1243781.1 TetR/AcrR family transcriptional regulator [Oryzomicrobium sp.]